MVLHVEGNYRNNNQYTEILRKHLGKYYSREKNGTIFWQATIESKKPLGDMTESEMYEFFQRTYCTGDVNAVICAINLAAQEYRENKS